jgi:hypothetical protein
MLPSKSESIQREIQSTMRTASLKSKVGYATMAKRKRFGFLAYKMMNQLLKSIDIITDHWNLLFSKIEANIYIIRINSVYFFTSRNQETYDLIKNLKKNMF